MEQSSFNEYFVESCSEVKHDRGDMIDIHNDSNEDFIKGSFMTIFKTVQECVVTKTSCLVCFLFCSWIQETSHATWLSHHMTVKLLMLIARKRSKIFFSRRKASDWAEFSGKCHCLSICKPKNRWEDSYLKLQFISIFIPVCFSL